MAEETKQQEAEQPEKTYSAAEYTALQEQLNAARNSLKETAEKLTGILLKFKIGAGADGHLYGSVTAKEIAEKGLNVRQTEVLCKKLSKPPKPPKPKPDPFNRPKRAVEIEAALKEVTGSEVHVDYKDGKGSLKIDFYSDEMLQQFVSLLGQYDPERQD